MQIHKVTTQTYSNKQIKINTKISSNTIKNQKQQPVNTTQNELNKISKSQQYTAKVLSTLILLFKTINTPTQITNNNSITTTQNLNIYSINQKSTNNTNTNNTTQNESPSIHKVHNITSGKHKQKSNKNNKHSQNTNQATKPNNNHLTATKSTNQ